MLREYLGDAAGSEDATALDPAPPAAPGIDGCAAGEVNIGGKCRNLAG